ncbi:hypothetical protein M9H77_27766 [Catharanthus roseus]|uniref:Uncharacterized protein n=1 Tax=Catharanthus roseus TaxID=4058 RepID=A0ACC0AHR1_CATRO|nr:hypothetical protein M9H77_27766 [Catharanthus roseus]
MIGGYNPQKQASTAKKSPTIFYLYLCLFSFLTANSLTSPTDNKNRERTTAAEPKDQEEKPRVSKTPKDRENGETVQRRRARDYTRNEAAATIKRGAGRKFRGSPTDGPGGQPEPPGHP